MEKALPQLESARTILRLANSDDVLAIIRYYIENQVHLAPFEPLRLPAFYTQSYWYEQVKQSLDELCTDSPFNAFRCTTEFFEWFDEPLKVVPWRHDDVFGQ
jgi:ribosomal-protein-alanine N-acetyltransferase